LDEWRRLLNDDPLPWLLEEADPGPRHLALRDLLDRPADDPELAAARSAAMGSDPIASILAAQAPDGWWVRPGYGYNPKYSSTVWSVMFLEELGADGNDVRVERACEYVLEWSQTPSGGFGVSGATGRRVHASSAVHCLNGNLLRALIGFGRLDHERVQRSVAWQASAITGEGMERWYCETPGPGFACAYNYGRPCAWGAVKALRALARIPVDRRSPDVSRAIAIAGGFLVSRDPAAADYPTNGRTSSPSASWFKLGFPTGYVTDVLQNLEALCEAGLAADPRLDNAFAWLLARQDSLGRWKNERTSEGKLVRDIDRRGEPSKWMTLRVCRVLKARTLAAACATTG
jgi:hypothetical protein